LLIGERARPVCFGFSLALSYFGNPPRKSNKKSRVSCYYDHTLIDKKMTKYFFGVPHPAKFK
jgi:hypothetical protein